MQATVQVGIVFVADGVQRPDHTSGPAAAFVVVDHIDGVRVVPQFGKQLFQLAPLRQQARCRRQAQLGALGVDEAYQLGLYRREARFKRRVGRAVPSQTDAS